MSDPTGQKNMIPRLLAPIRIEALVVGRDPADEMSGMFHWTNLAADFSRLREDYLFGAELVSDGNPLNEAEPLKPGIHLHFRLPRPLIHGNQEGAGEIAFPPVPNRWLVQRYGGGSEADGWTHKAWLVRSDGDSPAGVTWPIFHEDGQVEFVRFGAWDELLDPPAERDEPARMKITAVGPGDPAFSAFYPACGGILGFHDPLGDMPGAARLSYLVTGWYSDPHDDPLARFLQDVAPEQRMQQVTKFRAWAGEQGWTVAGPETDAPPPSRLLLHGLVRGITWNGPDANYLQPAYPDAAPGQPSLFPPDPDALEKAYRIAIGMTPAEAIAALLTPGEIDRDLLAALQDDMLSQPVSAADLQHELHERRFGHVQGGRVYQLRPASGQPDAGRGDEAPPPAGSSTIPAELRTLLGNLNTARQRYDRLCRRVEEWRWQVHALWHLWTRERKNGESEKTDLLRQQFDRAEDALKTGQAALNSAREEWQRSLRDLDAGLTRYPVPLADGSPRLNGDGKVEPGYRLTQAAAAPFRRPNDPVLALQGPALARFNSEPPGGSPACRISGHQVSAIRLQPLGGGLVTITGEQLMDEIFKNRDSLPVSGIHRDLLGEALLFDGRLASVIARLAGKEQRDDLIATVRQLQDPNSASGQRELPATPNALTGVRPDRSAMSDWSGNPWIPLFLAWEVRYCSDYRDDRPLPQDLITGRWRLGENRSSGHCDLVPLDGTEQPGWIEAPAYTGYSTLTPGTADNLAKRLKELAGTHPLSDALADSNRKIQTLMLDGFNDALTLQRPGLQLPPLSYQAWLDGSCTLDPVHDVINQGFEERRDSFRTTPAWGGEPFLPIRAGRLKIRQLAIVDAFGQTLKLPVERINQSATRDWQARMLRRAHSCMADPCRPAPDEAFVELRPRFVQPMRLRFQWENASPDGEKNGGPVCGWILPNHLEKSLTVYSAGGKALGALQRKLGLASGSSAPAFTWSDVPGESDGGWHAAGQDLHEHLTGIIGNPHLLYFCSWALGLCPDDGAAFCAIIDRAMASADQRVPEEDPGVALLVGRPLALVRASLRFETAGLPAHRPELRAGAAGTAVDELLETLDFERVRWPLRLGDSHARNDGLVGVFGCSSSSLDGAVTTSGPFYPVWGQDRKIERGSIPVMDVQSFAIDAIQPLQVTMLMDPQARVHATTGVLPRSFLELPLEILTGARRAAEVFFQTAPLLGTAATPQMPKPSDDYGQWSWAHRPDVTCWKLDPTIVEATDRAAFSGTWPVIVEGWLKLAIAPVMVLSFWIREPVEAVARGTRICLAWSLQGAERLVLEQIPKGGPPVVLGRWDAPPFPRECAVTVETETEYRISAYADDCPASVKQLTVKLDG